MTDPALMLAAAAVSGTLISGSALLLMRQLRREQALLARVDVARGLARAMPAGDRPVADRVAALRLVAGLGLAIVRSGLLSARTMADLEQTLVAAGFRAESAIGLFIGCKILLLLLFPSMGFALLPADAKPMTLSLVLAGGAVAGLLAPDTVVKKIREAYRRKLERGIPDALDMMVICAQAGLGLEPAIARVSIEIRHAHQKVAHELAQTASEMQVMADSRSALLRLGDRTGVENLKRLAGTLAQSLQYGTPLSDAMRGLAAEMRQQMLTAFEERAARLPVFLTIPMILFILPCVMIVVGGPAMINVIRALSH